MDWRDECKRIYFAGLSPNWSEVSAFNAGWKLRGHYEDAQQSKMEYEQDQLCHAIDHVLSDLDIEPWDEFKEDIEFIYVKINDAIKQLEHIKTMIRPELHPIQPPSESP
jgi:hypothetical protein